MKLWREEYKTPVEDDSSDDEEEEKFNWWQDHDDQTYFCLGTKYKTWYKKGE